MVNHGYLDRLVDLKKIACQTRKFDHKRKSKYIPERLLKRYHET